MAKGNWEANPPPQSEAGEVNQNRGAEKDFAYSQPARETGKVGTANAVPNETIPSSREPAGKPKL